MSNFNKIDTEAPIIFLFGEVATIVG